MKPNLSRALVILLLLSILGLGIPLAAQAAPLAPSLEVIHVQAGVLVTVRAHDMPGGKLFTVRMGTDQSGQQGADGAIITVTNSGGGGTFDESYPIPAALQTEPKITLRFESAGLSYSTSFTNQPGPTSTPVSTLAPAQAGSTPAAQIIPLSGQTGGRSRISVIAVEKDKAITVRATNLPGGIEFVVRVGPYETFFNDYAITGRIPSGAGGSFDFVVVLPEALKKSDLMTVRLDGGGLALFNAFKNATAGSIPTLAPSPSPVPTLPASAIPGACSVTALAPSAAVKPGVDLDAVWKVKNTSGQAWETSAVDYVYVNGSTLHKKTAYDIPKAVQNGETFEVIVDMRAPSATGVYSENWAIVQGGTRYCDLPVTVTVR